jgi:hypothetical protein
MAGPVARVGIPDLIREAIDETRDWIKAEIALLRSQVSDTLAKYAIAALAWVLAAVLALIAFFYLAYAVMLLLSPYIGEVFAALAVGSTLLAAAVVASFYGRAKFLSARVMPGWIAQALAEGDPGKKGAVR